MKSSHNPDLQYPHWKTSEVHSVLAARCLPARTWLQMLGWSSCHVLHMLADQLISSMSFLPDIRNILFSSFYKVTVVHHYWQPCIFLIDIIIIQSYAGQCENLILAHVDNDRVGIIGIYSTTYYFFFILFFSKQSFSVEPWLFWNLLCRPGGPWTQRSACLCFPSAGIKGMCHHLLAAL